MGIGTGAGLGAAGRTGRRLTAIAADIQQNAGSAHRRYQRTSAKADERQRYAGRGRDGHRNRNVNDGLQDDKRGDAYSQQGTECVR